MSENGQPSVPRMPWGIHLDGAAVDVNPLAAGQIEVVLTPIAIADGRVAMMPPQVRVVFSDEGFARFQEIVAAGGRRSPIHLARALPPEPPTA